MSLVTPDFGLLFWMVIVFAILFLILAKVGFPIITGMVDKRQERIGNSIRLAKEAEDKVKELAAEHDRMVEDARKEQARIMKEAAAARDAAVAQAQERAGKEADRILAAARAEIASEKEAALRDIRRQAAMLSVEVAEKVLRDRLSSEESQLDLIEKLVGEAERNSTQS